MLYNNPLIGYCFCGGKDEGEMIYCENKSCRNGQWFHFKCVQMKTAPSFALIPVMKNFSVIND